MEFFAGVSRAMDERSGYNMWTNALDEALEILDITLSV